MAWITTEFLIVAYIWNQIVRCLSGNTIHTGWLYSSSDSCNLIRTSPHLSSHSLVHKAVRDASLRSYFTLRVSIATMAWVICHGCVLRLSRMCIAFIMEMYCVCHGDVLPLSGGVLRLSRLSQSCITSVTEVYCVCHKVVLRLSRSYIASATEVYYLCHIGVLRLSRMCLIFPIELYESTIWRDCDSCMQS